MFFAGNGLKLISDELKKHPEIEFQWTQPEMSFRTTFLRANYKEEQEVKRKKTDSTTDNLSSRPIATDYDRLLTITDDYERLSIEQQKYCCICWIIKG